MTISYPPPGQPSYQPSFTGYGLPGYQPYGPTVPSQRSDYSRWGRRLGAFGIDMAPCLVAAAGFVVVYVLALRAALAGGASSDVRRVLIGAIVVAALCLLSLGWLIYNRWITAGRTGRSLGKRRLRLSVVSESTGAPIGAGNAFLRDLVHILDALTIVGFLWPLWDDKRQTFADMLTKTVVVADAPSTTGPAI